MKVRVLLICMISQHGHLSSPEFVLNFVSQCFVPIMHTPTTEDVCLAQTPPPAPKEIPFKLHTSSTSTYFLCACVVKSKIVVLLLLLLLLLLPIHSNGGNLPKYLYQLPQLQRLVDESLVPSN